MNTGAAVLRVCPDEAESIIGPARRVSLSAARLRHD